MSAGQEMRRAMGRIGALAALLAGACAARPAGPPVAFVVSATWPDAGVGKVEQSLAVPLENGMAGLPGLVHVDSRSTEGAVEVTATFAPGTDRTADRSALTARLPTRVLPAGVRPRITSAPASEPLLAWSLSSNELSSTDLRTLADMRLRQGLLMVPGVADVTLCGGAVPVMTVRVDPARAAARQVSLSEVVHALQREDETPSGRETPGAADPPFGTIGQPSDAAAIADLVVTERDGMPVRVGDVSQVMLGAEPLPCDAFENGRPVVSGVVHLVGGQDVRSGRTAVQARLAEVASELPAIVHLETWAPSETVRLDVETARPLRGAQLAAAARAVEGAVRKDPAAKRVLVISKGAGEGSPIEVRVRVPPTGPPAAPPSPATARRLARAIAAAVPGCEVVPAELPAIRIRVSGPDLQTLHRLAEGARTLAETQPSVAGTRDSTAAETPRLRVVQDPQALARYGLSASDVALYVTAATGAPRIGVLEQNDAAIDVVVRVVGASAEPASLAHLPVVTSSGGVVELGSVARLEEEASPGSITRHDGWRVATVRVWIDGDPRQALAAVRASLAKSLALPPGYRLTLDFAP